MRYIVDLIELCRLFGMHDRRFPVSLKKDVPEGESEGVVSLKCRYLRRPWLEDFRAKDIDVSPFMPPIEGKTCLNACLVEKDGTVPSVFDGYLGKEDPPV